MPNEIIHNVQLNIPPPTSFETVKALRSEVVQEIISRKPSFAERWAMLLFLLILLLIFAGTWFIKYPDIVSVKATLISVNAPKEIKTKLDGRLIKLNVKEAQQVKAFEVIGLMESRANHYEVIALSKCIDSVQQLLTNNKPEVAAYMCSKQYLHLGEIQQAFQTFMQAHQLFEQYLSSGFYVQKKTMLQKDMSYLRKLDSILLQQETMQKEDLQLSEETFSANEKLKKEKVISAFDYRNEKSKLIGKQLSLPQISSSIINNESEQHSKQKEIAELENQIAQQKNIFNEALNTLKAQLDDWKAKYLLITPIAGKVSFASFLQENQQLQNNQSICFINPPNSEFYAAINIPQNNFGKIKQGQKVLLKFPSYPYEEFGSVEGRLDFISHIPTDSGYLAKIVLPEGLITNYKKPLQFSNGLKADGDIITQNMRLIQRFFYQFRNMVNQRQ
jgi:HlyD family secretion protein